MRFVVAVLSGKDGEVSCIKLLGDGIPREARIVGTNYDFEHDEFHVKVDHPSFPVRPEGSAYERIPVYFEDGVDGTYLELL